MSRWTSERCVEHCGKPAVQFLRSYFADGSRNCLLVAGAGFDPRSTVIAGELTPVLGDRLSALFLREERPGPDGRIAEEAARNVAELGRLVPNHRLESVDVFGEDGAVVLGRNVVSRARSASLNDVTDVVIDLSALSIGASFPLTKFFMEVKGPNVHVMVDAQSETDDEIVPTQTNSVVAPFGFRGELGIDETADAARLWMPTLAKTKRSMLNQIHTAVRPHDVAPILPFPSVMPRRGDGLLEAFGEELEGAWDVDARNLIYAAENNPLDLYRTLLRIDDHRRPVFEQVGGSLQIISPVGTKVLAIGALMAALERNFPIRYVESAGYGFELGGSQPERPLSLVHVWLYGDIYPL